MFSPAGLSKSLSSGSKVVSGVIEKYIGGFFSRYLARKQAYYEQKALDLEEMSKALAGHGYPLHEVERVHAAARKARFNASFYREAPEEARVLYNYLLTRDPTLGEIGFFVKHVALAIGAYTIVPCAITYQAFQFVFEYRKD